jgi:hypothetical protein
MRRIRVLQTLAVIVVLAAGVAFGWLAGGGEEPVQASEPVQFTPPTAVNDAAFTPPADIASTITIKSGEFGGSGSNYVCDRELLISSLTAKPDRMRAWARVEAIGTTPDAVAAYIRKLHPATLLRPTRVTTHTFVDGKAKRSQAILAEGTAVLIDDNRAIRVRCRTGSPLLDPIVATSETCKSCPPSFKKQDSWQLSETYYAVHPAPPVTSTDPDTAPKAPSKPVTITVEKQLPPQYIVKQNTKTVTVHVPSAPAPKPQIKTVTVVKVKTKTKTVKERGATRTVTVQSPPRTITVQSPPRTITVYEGSG